MNKFSILGISAACIFFTNTFAAIPEKAPVALTSTIREALNNHPRLMAARAQLDAAKKQLTASSQALYNPELELDTERTAANTSTLQISQTIDMGDQRGALTRIGQAELEKARAEYRLAGLELQHDLLSVLIEAHTRKELLQLSSQTLALMKEFVRISELRYKAGDLNRSELNLARLAYTAAVLEYARARASASAAAEKYRALFQRTPAVLAALPEKLPQVYQPQNLDNFLLTLPSVRIQKANIAIARSRVLLRKSEKTVNPTIALRGGKDGSDSLVGLTLSVPLNVRNTYRAEVEVAKKNKYAAEQAAQQAFRDYRARVIASTQQFSYLSEAWKNWRNTGQVSIKGQLDAIKRLWRAGDMSTAEYLVQLKQTMETQASGLELRSELWQSALEWLLVTSNLDKWLNITLETN